MKLFNRKKETASNDIQNYYAEERRDRTGVAWLLAAGTLIVTLLLALGLFYGGRWAYRAIFDSSDDTPAEITQQEEQGGAVDGTTEEPAETDDDQSSEETETSTEGLTSDTDEGSDSNDGQTSADSDDGATLPSSGPSTLPSTGPSEPEL